MSWKNKSAYNWIKKLITTSDQKIYKLMMQIWCRPHTQTRCVVSSRAGLLPDRKCSKPLSSAHEKREQKQIQYAPILFCSVYLIHQERETFSASRLQNQAVKRHATPGSKTAHALEPVLEVENSVVKAAGGLGWWVTELFVGLLWVRFGPWKFDLWGVVYYDVAARPDMERAQSVDEELCQKKSISS